MALGQNDGVSQLRSRLTQIAGIVVSFQLIGLAVAYVYSNYFGRATFADAYLFRSADSSPLALGATSAPILGDHHFGDFQWPLSTTKDLGRGGYYGSAQFFFYVVRDFPAAIGLLVSLALSVVCVLIAVKSLSRELSSAEAFAGTTLLFLVTQPVLLAFDRGQIHLLMVAMMILGFSLQSPESSKRERQLGAIFVGVAVSMKLVPAFFLLFFLRKHHRDRLLPGLCGFVAALLLPAAFVRSGIGSLLSVVGLQQFKKNDLTDNLYSSGSYFENTKAFNHSFKALIGVLHQHTAFVNDFLLLCFRHYSLVAAALVVSFSWIIVSKKLTDAQSLVVCAILSSRLMPISSGYTLVVFLIPVFLILADHVEERQKSNRFCVFICALTMMPAQVRFGWLPFNPNTYTYSSLLGPAISLLFLTVMLLKALLPARCQMGKVSFGARRLSPRAWGSTISQRYLN